MKKFILTSAVLISTFLCFAQQQKLSQEVRSDFCKNAIINYQYGKDAFKIWMIQSARAIGIKTEFDIEIAVQNINKNVELQEEFFKNIIRIGGSKDFILTQFTSIGMKAEYAYILTEYILSQYTLKSNTKETKDISINESYILNKKNLLKSFFSDATFINDSLIIRKQSVYNMSGSNIDINYRTEILKEFYCEEKNMIVLIIVSYNIDIELKEQCSNCYPIFSIVRFEKNSEDEKSSWRTKNQIPFFRVNEPNEQIKKAALVKMILNNDGYHLIFEWINSSNQIVKTYFDAVTLRHEINYIFDNN